MRTTIVPAQITSVEDRIAGNFTFSQVLLLIIPLITSTVVYVVMPAKLHLSVLKLVLICLQFAFFGGLAIRINGKIVAQWLVVYFQFFRRPRYYIFTKEDLTARDIPQVLIEQEELVMRPTTKVVTPNPAMSLREQMRIDRLLESPSLSVSFELAKKGGIDVSLVPTKD